MIISANKNISEKIITAAVKFAEIVIKKDKTKYDVYELEIYHDVVCVYGSINEVVYHEGIASCYIKDLT
jgi:hypothetical protein